LPPLQMLMAKKLAAATNSRSPKTSALKRKPRTSPVAATRIAIAIVVAPHLQKRLLERRLLPEFFFVAISALIFPRLKNIATCDLSDTAQNAVE
jgi:hypothetical protein